MLEKRFFAQQRFARSAAIRAAVIYGAVWIACFVSYWAGLATGAFGGGTIMGYTLLVLYVALPITGAVAAFLVGRSNAFGHRRLVVPLAIGILYGLFVSATFGLSTMLGLANIASADFGVLIAGFVPAALGLAIGWMSA